MFFFFLPMHLNNTNGQNKFSNFFHFKVLLEEPIKEDESEAIGKVKNFYASCVDMKKIEKRSEQPLIDLLDNEFGGWSLIGRESEKLSSMDWVIMTLPLCFLHDTHTIHLY